MATLCLLSLAVLLPFLPFAAGTQPPQQPSPAAVVLEFRLGIRTVGTQDGAPLYELTYNGGVNFAWNRTPSKFPDDETKAWMESVVRRSVSGLQPESKTLLQNPRIRIDRQSTAGLVHRQRLQCAAVKAEIVKMQWWKQLDSEVFTMMKILDDRGALWEYIYVSDTHGTLIVLVGFRTMDELQKAKAMDQAKAMDAAAPRRSLKEKALEPKEANISGYDWTAWAVYGVCTVFVVIGLCRVPCLYF